MTPDPMMPESVTPEEEDNMFELQTFLPYQLAVLADAVSQSIADLYQKNFNLSRAEWRILAALGDKTDMSGKELCAYTTLDKMQVSRALASLEKNGHILRKANAKDRRNQVLRLSNQGKNLLNQIIPLVKEREKLLINALKKDEQKAYFQMSQKIYHQAQKILNT
ncbi:MAG: MarR family winged helix-turn-helix transcriptional regulator [Cohaesibacter sp.]|nr:MarR family winged helix-turn-helix transcriptional regulator [Cohaesibacter sp.]MCV6602378.1 MarR family winged helix-turn-helix transcriptional regulator [Cohaesibacter sp.]